MGWSCSLEADNTLDAIKDACYRQTKTINMYVHRGARYFIELSRKEHVSGAITGKISKLGLNQMTGNDMILSESSFRIAGDGKIVRGTGLKELIGQGKKKTTRKKR